MISSSIVRIAKPEITTLEEALFRRYPHDEWATFARFGWRETDGTTIVCLNSIDLPQPGDLDENVAHVAIQEPYTLRTALAAERHRFAVGVIHSHPQDCPPEPSTIDDDMDHYYAEYFCDFAQDRPYISLIVSKMDGEFVISGRIFWRGRWNRVRHFAIEGRPGSTWKRAARSIDAVSGRRARFVAAFGEAATLALRNSSVAVIGAGGTGSAAIEVLARAGVGRIIVIDPDYLEESNLERVHGSTPSQAQKHLAKVEVAQQHVRQIDESIATDAYIGSLPQPAIVDAVATADVAIGCTDQQHSRLALSDIAIRYLVPTLDCGVVLEGQAGAITGQIAQIVRFLPADRCAWCRRLIIPAQLARELMSREEISIRRTAAAAAVSRGERGDAYWRDEVQLNTVGFHTTTVGALVAGYAIGWLTGRFAPPFSRMQMNLVAPLLETTDYDPVDDRECACRRMRGSADQGIGDALISPPEHWPSVRKM